VISKLNEIGLSQTEFEDDILIQEKSFCVDGKHPDLIRLHSSQLDIIKAHPMNKEGRIVIQVSFSMLMVS